MVFGYHQQTLISVMNALGYTFSNGSLLHIFSMHPWQDESQVIEGGMLDFQLGGCWLPCLNL